jgi:hypothetical protein|tara:strand:+ start:17 stop:118 length:102 start_codon:yes stop_codon:yes gene_type:complete
LLAEVEAADILVVVQVLEALERAKFHVLTQQVH